MGTVSNEHIPTQAIRDRVCDLVRSGAPVYIMAEILDMDEATLKKHYGKELKTAKCEAIERIGKTVYQLALEGDPKAYALYLKTQGASQGWVEKQVVEQVSSDDTLALKAKIAELEAKYAKDY